MVDKKDRFLVIGATGMLGGEVVKYLQLIGRTVVRATWPDSIAGAYQLDITDHKMARVLIQEVKPKIVYNCSAFTDVDGAESREELATAINAAGVGNLAKACREVNSMLVHISTDYVFNGQAHIPYQPDSPVSPQTAYGRSKLKGEELIAKVGGWWLIIRTSWLFGAGGKNFVDSMVTYAQTRPILNVVNDQIGCPTYAPDLARCMVELAEKNCQGIYHFCNQPPCSWFDLATKAVEKAGRQCLVEPCQSDEFPRPAPRPAYSVMDCKQTYADLGWTPRTWMEALQEHLGTK